MGKVAGGEGVQGGGGGFLGLLPLPPLFLLLLLLILIFICSNALAAAAMLGSRWGEKDEEGGGRGSGNWLRDWAGSSEAVLGEAGVIRCHPHSRKNRTGPAVQLKKTGTSSLTGSVPSKDRSRNRPGVNRMNRAVFARNR